MDLQVLLVEWEDTDLERIGAMVDHRAVAGADTEVEEVGATEVTGEVEDTEVIEEVEDMEVIVVVDMEAAEEAMEGTEVDSGETGMAVEVVEEDTGNEHPPGVPRQKVPSH